jgi:hypothetical protein
MQNASPHDSLDGLLAQHPFGNSAYIHQQLHTCYKRRLGKVSVHIPAAGQLLDALGRVDAYAQYRTIGDTVVRCAVQHALKQIETGTPYGLPLQQCEEVFRATVSCLEQGKIGPIGSGLAHRLGEESWHGWIWSEERSDDVFVRAFRRVIQENYGETQLCTLDAEELAMLAKGARLINELLPQMSRSALGHAHLVAAFSPVNSWATRGSSSQFRLSGTFFLTRARLSSAWWVAETLFHEALHQQLYDFRHGHTLLVPAYGEKEGPKVCSLWNLPNPTGSNYWDTDRVLAAFHVYVHLALLGRLAEQRADELSETYGPFERMTTSRDAVSRACYLAEQLKGVCWEQLGLAGQRVVDWFSSVLDAVDPSPPPRGSCIHLLLDRYRREGREIAYVLGKNGQNADWSQRLMLLAKGEIEVARGLLTAADAQSELGRFDHALAPFTDENLGTQFARVRGIISKIILDASPQGYGWTQNPQVSEEMMKQIIERSSEVLMPLLHK